MVDDTFEGGLGGRTRTSGRGCVASESGSSRGVPQVGMDSFEKHSLSDVDIQALLHALLPRFVFPGLTNFTRSSRSPSGPSRGFKLPALCSERWVWVYFKDRILVVRVVFSFPFLLFAFPGGELDEPVSSSDEPFSRRRDSRSESV